MSKDLPYLKFHPAEWFNGNISLEDYLVQGVFINVICFYWSRTGEVTLKILKRRFKDAATEINTLIESELIKLDGDKVVIDFLDEQFQERNNLSRQNSQNGKKGGRPPAVPTENIDSDKQKGEARAHFAPPTFDEVFKAFTDKAAETKWREDKNRSEATKFMSYYEANGWMVGRVKMKKWRSAVSSWISRDNTPSRPNTKGVVH